jgi:hypothetical protein
VPLEAVQDVHGTIRYRDKKVVCLCAFFRTPLQMMFMSAKTP